MAIAWKEIPTTEEPEPSLPFVYDYDDDGYLTADGQPMAEYDINREQMSDSIHILRAHLNAYRVAYVSGNNFIHFVEGDRTRYVSPDCYVVFEVDKDLRDNYKTWEHGGRVPSVVFEFTSKKTQKEDQTTTFVLYERVLGVREYILFDPKGDYLLPRLQGYRRNAAGFYEAMPMVEGRLYSEPLDLWLVPEGESVRYYDVKVGEFLRTPAESEAQRVEEQRRADSERRRANREAQERRKAQQRAAAAEGENERLRAELAALRGKGGGL